MFFEAIALIEPKLCFNHWNSFYIGPIGSFYNQVNDTGLESLWFDL
jgi:hypothetical protein